MDPNKVMEHALATLCELCQITSPSPVRLEAAQTILSFYTTGEPDFDPEDDGGGEDVPEGHSEEPEETIEVGERMSVDEAAARAQALAHVAEVTPIRRGSSEIGVLRT